VIAARLVLVTASLAAVGPAAGQTFEGRWAADLQACTDETAPVPSVTVTPLSLSWPAAACAVRTSYRLGNAWHVSARCWGEGAISEVPIRLQINGDRLVLNWSKARPEELRRCP
jgi:hypothetical protein